MHWRMGNPGSGPFPMWILSKLPHSPRPVTISKAPRRICMVPVVMMSHCAIRGKEREAHAVPGGFKALGAPKRPSTPPFRHCLRMAQERESSCEKRSCSMGGGGKDGESYAPKARSSLLSCSRHRVRKLFRRLRKVGWEIPSMARASASLISPARFFL